jgi:hypothetical protein
MEILSLALVNLFTLVDFWQVIFIAESLKFTEGDMSKQMSSIKACPRFADGIY